MLDGLWFCHSCSTVILSFITPVFWVQRKSRLKNFNYVLGEIATFLGKVIYISEIKELK